MRNIFVISDTHFNHVNILKFTYGEDQRLVRPGFDSVEHMNETIIERWNKTVAPGDIVYHLGDFTFGSKNNIAKLAPRLNGSKRLIMGNHDYEPKYYYPYFEKIMSWRHFSKKDQYKRSMVLCHYPLYKGAFDYREGIGDDAINVHGHLHQNLTKESYHVNVCVEHTNYTPVSLEDIADGKYKNATIL